ncbi:MAG TPA: hypothetical protein VFF50_10565 [Candidatus Deferrimicrobiaceae bacterium]|nr:hypothetical protein [Candidatus Deferrimicrobiaceae bacterium]
MRPSRRSPLLASLILFAASASFCQSNDAGQSQIPPPGSPPKQTAGAPAEPASAPISANAPHISKQTRLEIIRVFETQLVYARTAFPMGTKGLQLKQGVITPNGVDLEQALNLWGPAVKPGDPAHISFVQIKNDHIRFEINGGPILRKKWYQHVQVYGANGPVAQTDAMPQTNAHGSCVDLYFDKYVPEMTAGQVRDLLFPVLDFKARSKEQAYLDSVPPKVKSAIQAHHVLVGMNQEMVLHAKGKPPKKVRERDGETQYEEWIYGDAPADVDFVRFIGDEVVRVETMKVDGEKIVRTQKEVILEHPADKEAQREPQERPATAPSLKRPGEDSQPGTGADDGSNPRPIVPLPPDLPPPANGPGEMASGR